MCITIMDTDTVSNNGHYILDHDKSVVPYITIKTHVEINSFVSIKCIVKGWKCRYLYSAIEKLFWYRMNTKCHEIHRFK